MLSFLKQYGRRYKEILLYVLFGGLTTLVNIGVYFICARFFSVGTVLATVVAWVLSVLFAYVTNKIWVFESKNCRLSALAGEILLFFGCRAFSGILDVVLMWIFVDRLGFYDVAVKILSNLIVIILNYLFSKLLIFRKKKVRPASEKE